MEPAIIISSFTAGLGVIRALGIQDIPVVVFSYDKRDMGHVSKYVKEVVRIPHPEECEQEFIDVLLTKADHYRGNILIPTSDAALAAVSRNKVTLDQFYRVACTEWEITEKFLVKKYTYALADAIGVPSPITAIPKTIADVESYSQSIQYPCLVKPCQSHLYYAKFKEKMVKVENLDQMIAAYQKAQGSGYEVMLQEFIPGDDTLGVNYNSYFWDNEPLVEFTAQKIRNAPPELGSPRVVISKEIPEVIEPGRKILKAMGFYGFSCTEFKKDPRDNVYKLMEINGRHNLSSALAVKCGINFPYLQYRHLVEGVNPSGNDYQYGVYWTEVTRDLSYTIKYFRQERLSIYQYLQPYFGPHVDAIFDSRDIRPFLMRCKNIIKGGIPLH